MRLLFLTAPEQDILADSLLHGLRTILGDRCVDFPRKDVLYRDYVPPVGASPYGNLFTLWKTLEDLSIDRTNVVERVRRDEFDFVVVGSVHRSIDQLRRFSRLSTRRRLIVLDGEDSRAVVGEALRFPYFKRELDRITSVWVHDSQGHPRALRLPAPTHVLRLRPISFSIPAEKVVHAPRPAARRTKLFPDHIVDAELKSLVGRTVSSASPRGYVHQQEATYYEDLATSLFGITTKRAGWDCLRHYELAANGAIICFRELERKPPRCAPHGLTASNSISYRNAGELLRRISHLTMGECDALIEASYGWAMTSTTERRALSLLDSVRQRNGWKGIRFWPKTLR
jgi:hypothetical protein